MTRRPTIKSPCVADRYATGAARIAEFSTTAGNGGLMEVREMEDGTAQVNLYRLDKGTVVFCPPENLRPSIGPGSLDVQAAARAMLAALKRLREWEGIMGGWDAPAWQGLAEVIAQAEAAGLKAEG